MSKAPSMPVFTDALLGDTLHLSAEEFGAYCLLLFATWRNNGEALPDDGAELSQICRVPQARWRTHMRSKLVRFFDISDGYWHQKRLEKEWDYVQRKAEVNRANGARGGRPKEPNKNPPVNPTVTPTVNPTKTEIEPNDNPKGTQTESTHTHTHKAASKQLETDSLPREWAARAGAARLAAGLPEVELQPHWAKFISKVGDDPSVERWVGWALKARQPAAGKRQNGASELPDVPWPQRCRSWARGHRWLADWGPAPDEPGCWAPREIVADALSRKQAERVIGAARPA